MCTDSNVEVKVLGVAGSHRRRGHTVRLVQEALEAAELVPGVKTELVNLVEKKIRACLSCSDKKTGMLVCSYFLDPHAFEPGARPRCVIKDDMTNEVYDKLLDADGIIIGSPVYFGSVSGILKDFMDRTTPLKARRFWLRDKVGGALSVAMQRHGGQEFTILAIEQWMRINGMIFVGDGAPNEDDVQRHEQTKHEYGPAGKTSVIWGRSHYAGAWADPFLGEIDHDLPGLLNARGLGRHVAQVATWIKMARAVDPWVAERRTFPLTTKGLPDVVTEAQDLEIYQLESII